MEVTKFGIDVDRKEGRLIKTAVRLVRMYIGQGFVMCPDADLEKIVVDVISEVVPNGDNDLETLKALVKSQLQQFDSRYGKDKTPVIAAFRSLVLRAIDATDKGKVLNSFGFDDDGKWNFLFK